MICGNAHSFDLLQKAIAQSDSFPFVLLVGPGQIGKSTAALTYVRHCLGDYVRQDFLHIQDQTTVFGKKHSIKVENNEVITISKEENYQDRGAREIIDRLNLSPVWNRKIVLLENIERMTIAATNALLKSLEEPLPQRQIIATVSNKDLLLETILSRALVIYAHLVPIAEIQTRLEGDYSSQQVDKRKNATYIAAGRPWRAKLLLDNESSFSALIESFDQLKLYRQRGNITKLYKTLVQADKDANLDMLLDAWTYWEDDHKCYDKLASISHHRRMIEANVSRDSVLFSLALS